MMKVTLDLTALLRDGAITATEHDRLARLGRQDTSLLMVNVLIGFGVIAVTLATLALIPSSLAGATIGALLMAAGIALVHADLPRWRVLANICVAIAALLLGAGIVLLSQGVRAPDADPTAGASMPLAVACMVVACLFTLCAGLARSGLLIALAVLVLFGAVGGSSWYQHAGYGLEVTQPLATAVLFGALALAAHLASRALAPPWERLATIAARTALFVANLGLWIGSLWGDDLAWLGHHDHPTLAAPVFAVGWAVLLIGVGVWAGRTDRRWVLNLAAVFGGIHFYTQWFEYVGANPGSLLAGGLIVLACALGLWRLNHTPRSPLPDTAGS